jgi:hypothetical protein
MNSITAQDYDASLYSDGPVQLAYPPDVYAYPGSEAFVESLSAIGLPKYIVPYNLMDVHKLTHVS